MADSKISALPAATTPLAGTEVLPIVQSGSTVKATVANIVGAGTSPGAFTTLSASGATRVSSSAAANLTIDGSGAINIASIAVPSGDVIGQGITLSQRYASGVDLSQTPTGAIYGYRTASIGTAGGGLKIYTKPNGGAASSLAVTIDNSQVVTLTNNLVPSTAAKGINFTANTPAAGMTSQLLNWYEEGTWTPAQGAGLTLVGAFSSTGKYTRIGRSVTISGTVTGATSVAVTAAGVITSNLPFTAGTAGHGSSTNAANTAFASVICTTTNVTSAGAIAATATITFSATYFV